MSPGRRKSGPSHTMGRPDMIARDDSSPAGAVSCASPPTAPDISRTVLAIAGMDPSGGAGIAADLKTIGAYRHNGAAVVTSITVQNTVSIRAVYDLPEELVARQIEAILSDFTVDAVKIGMLGTAGTTERVAAAIRGQDLPNVVLDPVLRSSSGTPLLEKKGLAVLRQKLLPLALVVTPNMAEAAALTGLRVTDLDSMKEAARKLHAMGARHAVVTGGHLGARAIDILFDGARFAIYDSMRIQTSSTHGIGCTFSTAVACQLARGVGAADAVGGAKRDVSRAAQKAPRIGKGAGPLNHLVTPF
ncbi:MAG: bifunctional hydroxymethylpyrimidine kinase/phosphomethylpyrimidine kinase [Acidobacteriota bacterium]